ncbi:MAG: hypothetical protein Q7T56_02930 [Nocardioidaceae bacterium]|nr:hypothetical protein [Nocardioidaceae bacterium]
MHALLLAAEETRELPVHPAVFGVIALVILIGLLMAVLSFGKGREHT